MIISSLYVTEKSAAVATVAAGNKISLIDIWEASENDNRIFQAAMKLGPNQYVVNPNVRSKDESFWADQLKRYGEKNIEILQPFHSELGISVMQGQQANGTFSTDLCKQWPVLAREIQAQPASFSSALMAVFQALIFEKEGIPQKKEFGFGMALGSNPRIRANSNRYDPALDPLAGDPQAVRGHQPRSYGQIRNGARQDRRQCKAGGRAC